MGLTDTPKTMGVMRPVAALEAGQLRIGGKAWGLAKLEGLDLGAATIPPWFVVASEASVGHLGRAGVLEDTITALGALSSGAASLEETSAQLTSRVRDAPLRPELAEHIASELKNLGDGPFAVRSSMVGEDSAERSFAGQLSSFLFCRDATEVLEAVVGCWASAFSPHALAYQRHSLHGIVLPRVAVVVQTMIDGEVSGVTFSAHPTTGRRDHCLITAAWGLGEGIVGGACDTDEYTWQHGGGELDAKIARKQVAVVARGPGKTGTEEVAVAGDRQEMRCLTRDQVAQLGELATTVQVAFACPQDIEWTWTGDRLHVLQSRPITALPEPETLEGPRIVFDNSNIQESYCGVTTPLTFSFAQGAYASVYEQTMRAVGIDEAVIGDHQEMLRNMLGLVRGRVFYNINNWYRGLLLLPSFGRNKADMEAMMGLEDPVDFIEDQVLSVGQKLRRLPNMGATLVRLLVRFWRLPSDVPRFLADFEAAYARVDRDRFAAASFSELTETVAQLRREMLENWSTPIINDTYVMMMTGRLRRLVASSGLENHAEIANNLLSGEEGIESLEPTRVLMRLAREAMQDAELQQLLATGDPLDALARVRRARPEYSAKVDAYIERYGDRVIGELKLETITVREDPSFVVAVLRNYFARPDLDPDALANREKGLRHAAEDTLNARLGPLRRLRARRVIATARAAVKYRENMRLARTRMFGLFRDAYRAMGDRLTEVGKLEAPRDVFYLSTGELLAYQEGRAVSADLKSLAIARKAEYTRYENQHVPHHFETRGPVYHGNRYQGPDRGARPDSRTATLSGTGCYPGRVEAPLRVVMSPADNLSMEGHILTTLRTDPGWAPLFPASAGILVERGSTLSHSAVVARELGIPAVVGVPGLLQVVRDGEHVRLDGGAGTVQRLEVAEP